MWNFDFFHKNPKISNVPFGKWSKRKNVHFRNKFKQFLAIFELFLVIFEKWFQRQIEFLSMVPLTPQHKINRTKSFFSESDFLLEERKFWIFVARNHCQGDKITDFHEGNFHSKYSRRPPRSFLLNSGGRLAIILMTALLEHYVIFQCIWWPYSN